MKRPLTALALLTATAASTAHETWLLPSDFSAPAGESLEFSMTSGMGFPDLGSGIDPTRLSEAVLMLEDERRSLVPSAAREGALVLSGIPEGGLACAWVHLHPRILEIPEAESIEHYLEEIGAPEAVWEAWKQDGGLWRESYSKLARTYVRSSAGGESRCISEASEARFEILPMRDPTDLAPGDTLELQVLFDGEPLSGQAIGLVREGQEPDALLRSDDAGKVVITASGPGRHMIYATNLRPADGDEFNWESDFTTLTFEVQP
jgi:hypothetical protein